MTPAERAVIEAARAWAATWERLPDGNSLPLYRAVEALETELAGGQDLTRVEMSIPWTQVVEGDEIQARPGGRWYAVFSAVRHVGSPTVTVKVRDLPKPITATASNKVTVRRGATGMAADVFTVIFSGEEADRAQA